MGDLEIELVKIVQQKVQVAWIWKIKNGWNILGADYGWNQNIYINEHAAVGNFSNLIYEM